MGRLALASSINSKIWQRTEAMHYSFCIGKARDASGHTKLRGEPREGQMVVGRTFQRKIAKEE